MTKDELYSKLEKEFERNCSVNPVIAQLNKVRTYAAEIQLQDFSDNERQEANQSASFCKHPTPF